jgi:hypothetical protein
VTDSETAPLTNTAFVKGHAGYRIVLVTPTGDRPEAFALCEKYVASQTVKPDVWIVVDDGEVPAVCTMKQHYIRRNRQIDEMSHTLPLNMVEAHATVPDDPAVRRGQNTVSRPPGRDRARRARHLDTHRAVDGQFRSGRRRKA